MSRSEAVTRISALCVNLVICVVGVYLYWGTPYAFIIYLLSVIASNTMRPNP